MIHTLCPPKNVSKCLRVVSLLEKIPESSQTAFYPQTLNTHELFVNLLEGGPSRPHQKKDTAFLHFFFFFLAGCHRLPMGHPRDSRAQSPLQ